MKGTKMKVNPLQFLILLVQFSLGLCSTLTSKSLLIYDPVFEPKVEQYTELFNTLNYELTLLSTQDPNPIELLRNEVLLYSNVVLFTTKSKSIELSPSKLLNYVEKGGNVIVLTNPKFINPSIRSFLNELGIYPSPKNHHLIDHFQNIDEDHKLIKLTSENVITSSIINEQQQEAEEEENLPDLQYKGSVSLLSNNPLLFPIIQAPKTSYSKNIIDDDLTQENWAIGTQGYLIVAHQSLNNGRILWIGDEDFLILNDLQIAKNLINWTFGLRNILKINQISHSHITGESYDEKPYKINDEISYNISISSNNNGELKDFITNDLQLDVKLLDPYHRLNLKILQKLSNETIYGIVFKLPDHHGIFTFELNFNKPGYSYLNSKDIKSIRHLANDEFLRSWDITNSWVYITSSIVVFIGWFIFVWSFIYSSGKTSVIEPTIKKDQ